jgi:uncharacterized protein YjcR
MRKSVKTLAEIANEYGVHVKTLRRWILPIRDNLQIVNRKLLVSWQIELIHKFIEEKK